MKNVFLALFLSLMSLTASAAPFLNIEEYDILYEAQQNVTDCQPCLPSPFETSFEVNSLPDFETIFTVFHTHPSEEQQTSEAFFTQYNLRDPGDNIVSSAALANLEAFSFAFQALANTEYTLELFGEQFTSPVRVHVAGIAQTPIPAALWLFGPLMIGFLALRKRFMQ